MTNEEIQKHIRQNCRNEHGQPMMDEQAFYEGAKWMRDKALTITSVVGRSEQLCQHKYQDIRYGTSRCVICGKEEQSF